MHLFFHFRLLAHIRGNVGFVFTRGDLVDVRDKLLENKVKAPARAGAIAPCPVIIPAQNTGLGPEKTSFFQALSIPTKISKGTIEIIVSICWGLNSFTFEVCSCIMAAKWKFFYFRMMCTFLKKVTRLVPAKPPCWICLTSLPSTMVWLWKWCMTLAPSLSLRFLTSNQRISVSSSWRYGFSLLVFLLWNCGSF